MAQQGFGIDFGGTGIKGAPVDLDAGELAGDRTRIPTPKPAKPHPVAEVVGQILAAFPDTPTDQTVGIAIPAVVQHGVARSAANIDHDWIDLDADKLFTELLKRPVHVVNDADAAGVAEARYGAAKGVKGLVMLVTLGTGIGTAIMVDGQLVPNTELGHVWLENGKEAEKWAATSVREAEDLSYKKWAKRLQVYFEYLEKLFSPDLFIVGGGISKNSEKFLPLLELATEIIPATLINNAGIIGAAALADDEN